MEMQIHLSRLLATQIPCVQPYPHMTKEEQVTIQPQKITMSNGLVGNKDILRQRKRFAKLSSLSNGEFTFDL
jgi:hypothetical protein